MEEYFAVGAPGLEPLLAVELTELGLRRPKIFTAPDDYPGYVAFDAGKNVVLKANLHLRCADRVIVRLGTFKATTFPEFKAETSRLAWERFVSPGRTVRFRVKCAKSKLNHEAAIAQRAGEALSARLKAEVKASSEDSAPLILIQATQDVFTVDIDSSGEPLHRRGYRLASAKAPLKETLAAALLIASGWDKKSTFLDPLCGSGTIAIEAALMAEGLAPGRDRRFAFMDWPGFDHGDWEWTKAAVRHFPMAPYPKILASDRDEGAIRAARANAERAGVSERIEFSVRALSAVGPPPGPGFIVTNPPYGVRVGEGKDLRDLYAQLGNVVRGLGPEWTTTILSGDPRLTRATGLSFDEGLSTLNGGLSVRLSSCRPR